MKTKQRRDRRGRVLRTAAQRRKLISDWRESGLSQAAFCVRHGVHPTTFTTWCRATNPKAPRAGKNSPSTKFAEFQMPVGGSAPVEVELPNGVKFLVRQTGMLRELVRLLRSEVPC